MLRSKSGFEKALDKATSNLLLEPDLDGMLQLCDMIRGGDVKPRDAAQLIKSRVIDEKNPHQQFFAINVMDTVMKNCGDAIHNEVVTEPYMEKLKELLRVNKSENVKNKVLEMIQCWGVAFKNNSKLKISTNLYSVLKAEGYKFPPEQDMSGMFKSENAPIWHDGNECANCKVEFGFINRKHHCRACGGIFCSKCTSKQAIIPKFGIEKEVRVCDKCYGELNAKSRKSPVDVNGLPAEYLKSSLYKQSQEPPKRDDAALKEAALKEDEELQLALALSLDEQHNQEQIRREQQKKTESLYSAVTKHPVVNASNDNAQSHTVDAETDPELAKYLNRSLWEKKKEKQDEQKAKMVNGRSSPKSGATGRSSPKIVANPAEEQPQQPTVVAESKLQTSAEDQQFLDNLRASVEIFTNRMRSNKMRGRSISNDSAVQTLFQSINGMHPKVIQMLNELEEERLHHEALQDKLVQVRDARAALDALRADHADKLRRAAEEAERQRQIQMAHKLEVMRQKKQEYLAYQRQLALQRMQEQEAQRQARLEQQKQFIQHRAMQPSMMVTGYGNQYMSAPGQQQDGTDTVDQMQSQYGMYAGVPMQNMPQQYPGQMYAANMQPANYAYAGNQQPQNQFAPNNYQAMAMQPQPGMGQGGVQPQPNSTEPYNMAAVQGALPNTVPASTDPSQQPPVVASAPPQTPQPTPRPSMTVNNVMDPSGGYPMQQQPPQQQFYPQDGVVSTAQPAQPQQNTQASEQQNLLIMFD